MLLPAPARLPTCTRLPALRRRSGGGRLLPAAPGLLRLRAGAGGGRAHRPPCAVLHGPHRPAAGGGRAPRGRVRWRPPAQQGAGSSAWAGEGCLPGLHLPPACGVLLGPGRACTPLLASNRRLSAVAGLRRRMRSGRGSGTARRARRGRARCGRRATRRRPWSATRRRWTSSRRTPSSLWRWVLAGGAGRWAKQQPVSECSSGAEAGLLCCPAPTQLLPKPLPTAPEAHFALLAFHAARRR